MDSTSDSGAFMKRFILPPTPPPPGLPLSSLTFAVKDMFDVKGYVPSFGNPDWERTHPEATSIAPTILALLDAGATCVGTTIMDELAYSIKGENMHYGTPTNPCVEHCVPGGSSSGSAVAVGANHVDFSIGTDCLGSARIPASYCGIFGIRPSHGVISESGVVPMAQSLDTVGWFAKDPNVLNRVGSVLLPSSLKIAPVRPTRVFIAYDCFPLSTIPYEALTGDIIKAIKKLYGGGVLKHENLGLYMMRKVPSLIEFMCKEEIDPICNIPVAIVSSAMQLLERYEFKNNHGEWVVDVKPNLAPDDIAKNVERALKTTGENIDLCHYIKRELRGALDALLGDFGVIMIPTVPGPPPRLQTNISELRGFSARAYGLQSIAGMSGCCQVSIPLGMHDNLPISISLVAKHGADGFLLSLVESIYDCMKEEEASHPKN